MNKRFWRGFLAIMLGMTLVLGSGGYQPVLMALAAETTTQAQPSGEQPSGVQPSSEQTGGTGATGGDSAPATSTDKSTPTPVPTATVESKATQAPTKKSVVYVGVGDPAEKKTKETSAGATIPTAGALGLNAPEGQVFSRWNTKATGGGTSYKAGDKFDKDLSKIPSTLYAQWKAIEPEPEAEVKGEDETSKAAASSANGELPPSAGETKPEGQAQQTGETNLNAFMVADDALAGANGAVTDGAAVDLGVVGDGAAADTGVVTDGAVVDPGVVTDGAVVDLGVVTDGAVIDSGVVTDGAVVDPGVVTDGAVVDPGAVTDGAAAKEITITYHVEDQSASYTSKVGEMIPGISEVGLDGSMPEGTVFYGWSVSKELADLDYPAGTKMDEGVPSNLYAMCVPGDMAIMPMLLPPPTTKFVEVRYFVDSSATTFTPHPDLATAKSPSDLGINVLNSQFLGWKTLSGAIIQPGQSIGNVADAEVTNVPGGNVLTLVGTWAAIDVTLPTFAISMSGSPAYLGKDQNQTITINVQNKSNITGYLRIEDVFATAEFSFVSASSSGTYNNGTVTWDLSLNGNANMTLTLTLKALRESGDITNTATVTKIAIPATAGATITEKLNNGTATNTKASYTTSVAQVIYDGNGGTYNITSPQIKDSTNYGSVQNYPFVRAGYQFVSWNTMNDGTGTKYMPGAPIDALSTFTNGKTLTLYAQWARPIIKISINRDKEAVVANDIVTYTIVVRNEGDVAANNVVVQDGISPTGMQFINANPSVTPDVNGKLNWTLKNIPAKGKQTITVTAKVISGSTSPSIAYQNIVEVLTIDGVAANTSNFPIESVFRAQVDTSTSEKLVIYNGNGGTLINGGTQFVGSGSIANASILNLENEFTRAGYVLAGWKRNNDTTIYTSGQLVAPLFTSPAQVRLDLYAVWTPTWNLGVTMTANKSSVTPGESVEFTITVVNSGAAPHTNVYVVVTPTGSLTSNATYVLGSAKASTGTYDETSSSKQWTIGSIGANSTATLKLTYQANSTPGTGAVLMENQVQITSPTTHVSPTQAAATVTLNKDAGALVVSNKVTGNNSSSTRDFTFTLKLKDNVGNTINTSGSYTTSAGVAGSFPMNQTLTFTLRHDQSIRFWGLPAGTQYTVEETDYSGYHVKQVKYSGVINGTQTVEFVNSRNRNTDIPKTGYGDGNEELLWLLLPLLAGAAWLMISKRRRSFNGKQ